MAKYSFAVREKAIFGIGVELLDVPDETKVCQLQELILAKVKLVRGDGVILPLYELCNETRDSLESVAFVKLRDTAFKSDALNVLTAKLVGACHGPAEPAAMMRAPR